MGDRTVNLQENNRIINTNGNQNAPNGQPLISALIKASG